MQIGAPETLALVDRAIAQMAAERGGKHTLKQIGQARKVTVSTKNIFVYISLNIFVYIKYICIYNNNKKHLTGKLETLISMLFSTTDD